MPDKAQYAVEDAKISMPEIALRSYLEEINRLIDDNQFAEAVGRCRHVLAQHPRHIETYRLMGKALLEQGEESAAVNVLQRVLSADPEDFVAHAGLAIAYKQQDRVDEAVWHMERAFDIDPYNAVIRHELNDLYGRRDGAPPMRIPLSRAALARLYVKGEKYPHAIAELRALLADTTGRIDLEVLLADALWRYGQRVDAVAVSDEILEKLPDCIKANAILAEVMSASGRGDEAQHYFQRIYHLVLPTTDVLDTDSAVGRAFAAEGALRLTPQILIEPMTRGLPVGLGEKDIGWVDELADEYVDMGGAEPEWLEAVRVDEANGDEVPAEQVAVEEVEDQGRGDAPEWIVGLDDAVELGDVEVDERPVEPPSPADEVDTEIVAAAAATLLWDAAREKETVTEPAPPSPTSEDDGPRSEELVIETGPEFEEDNMGATDEFGQDREEKPADETPETRPDSSEGMEGLEPDWLAELGEAEEIATPGQAPADEDLPDWLRDDADVNVGESLAWLDRQGEEVEEEAGEPPAPAAPDWLEEPEDDAEPAFAAPGDDDLSWLDEIAAGEGPPIEEPPTLTWPEQEGAAGEDEAADADWLDEMEEAEFSGPSDEVPVAAAQEFDTFGEPPEELEEAMAWLEQLAAQQGASLEELPSLSDLAQEDEEEILSEMPDDLGEAMAWLEELADEQPAEAVAAAESDADQAEPEDSAQEEIDVLEEELELPEWLVEYDDAAVEVAAEEASEPVYEEEEAIYIEEELDWLETLTDDEEEASAQAEEGVAAEATDDLDEALAWLEGLAANQGASLDELTSQPAEPEEAEVEQDFDVEETSFSDEAAAEFEEAYDWLDELGEDADARETEEAPVADAPAEALEMPAGEDERARPPADEVPEDIDEAMAWLEQLAARQGAALEELPTVEAPPDEQAPVVEAVAMLDDIPDDPEEALAWLESLAGEQTVEGEVEPGAVPEASEVVDEADTPAVPMDVVAARAEAEAALMREGRVQAEPEAEELEEMPEDPDEAMAWLERLAARQGASLDELPSLDEVEEELDTPAWIAQELAELEARVDEEEVDVADQRPAMESVAEDEVQPPQLASEALPVADEAPAASGDEAILDELAEELNDEDIEEALPDWLAIEGEEEDFEAWAEDAADLTQWLEAEEAATVTDTGPAAELVPAPEAALTFEAAPELADTPPDEEAEVPASEVEGRPNAEVDLSAFSASVVEEARNALRTGDLTAAVEHYRTLLESGDDVDALIMELKQGVEETPNRAIYQLLGDAYMQDGRLQPALDSYRRALETL